eukprot:TRINITY_DN123156_c0_g1_i1.p1 TRINITY_DN123156_c0_g1~~TRINITY_DN123156_c0_g1_i1.p1  ORF type:complete len:381 (+),score=85.86 TRINITY_DN123156_c0_g1_i1:167-1309(+)
MRLAASFGFHSSLLSYLLVFREIFASDCVLKAVRDTLIEEEEAAAAVETGLLEEDLESAFENVSVVASRTATLRLDAGERLTALRADRALVSALKEARSVQPSIGEQNEARPLKGHEEQLTAETTLARRTSPVVTTLSPSATPGPVAAKAKTTAMVSAVSGNGHAPEHAAHQRSLSAWQELGTLSWSVLPQALMRTALSVGALIQAQISNGVPAVHAEGKRSLQPLLSPGVAMAASRHQGYNASDCSSYGGTYNEQLGCALGCPCGTAASAAIWSCYTYYVDAGRQDDAKRPVYVDVGICGISVPVMFSVSFISISCCFVSFICLLLYIRRVTKDSAAVRDRDNDALVQPQSRGRRSLRADLLRSQPESAEAGPQREQHS